MKKLALKANPIILITRLPLSELFTVAEAARLMDCSNNDAKRMLDEIVDKTRLVVKIKFTDHEECYMRPTKTTSVEEVFWEAIRAKERKEAQTRCTS